MKKYFSLILALVLMFALAVPAFADDVQPGGNSEKDVTAEYTAPTDTADETVYRITIAWEPKTEANNALSYTGKQSTYTWNADSLVYDETINTAAGWSGAAGYEVTITNYSNAAVEAELSATNTYGLTLEKPAAETKTLGSAAVANGEKIDFTDTTTKGTAQSETFTYTYKANSSATAPTGDADATVTIGRITVTVIGE